MKTLSVANAALVLAVAASLAPAIAQEPKLPDDNVWPGISQRVDSGLPNAVTTGRAGREKREVVQIGGRRDRDAVIAAERIGDPATRLEGNTYREWLGMYAGSEYQELASEAAAALDEQFARRGGEGRFPSLTATFAAAARLEADFWQMGLEAKS